jgi:NAD(P)H-hydrate epimerase
MKPVLTPTQMRDADRTAIEVYGIPAVVLMEHAARSTAEILRQRFELSQQSQVLIACGSGNNGGDGLALARLLHEEVSVTVVKCGSADRMSKEAAINYQACLHLGIPIIEWHGPESALQLPPRPHLIVDALLGVGARGVPRPPMDSFIEWANAQPARRLALDVPSGLDAENGSASLPCFRAESTITMGALKTGLLLGDGPEMGGVIDIATIGIPQRTLHEGATVWLIEPSDIRIVYRPRRPRTNKFDYGRVLVIAGSAAMPGAAALCANAAVAAGAGLVELVTPQVHSALIPEVMPLCYDRPQLDCNVLPLLAQRIEQANVVVLGPGLGSHDDTLELVRTLLKRFGGNVPIVLDADGLRALGTEAVLHNITLTPHRGELARMLGFRSADIAHSAHERARSFAQQTGATVVLKDFPIQISNPHQTLWLDARNPALATGGTGDVLSGIIAALWAQGYQQFEAAWLGVAIHAEAGRIAAMRNGDLATRATMVIEALSDVSRSLCVP